jgi:hypothetical protein
MGEFFGDFFSGFFWRNFLVGYFWEKLFGGFFWEKFFLEELFGRNSLFTLLKLFEYERN